MTSPGAATMCSCFAPCVRSVAALTRDHGPRRSSPSSAAVGADRRQPARRAGGALSRLRALHHHGPRAARRARRPQTRAPPHPLRDAHPAARPGHRVQEMRENRRRRDGLVPPARRPGDLRGAGPPRAGFRLALSARRGSGQLRQYRRRQRRRLSLHRGAPHRIRAAAARGHRRGRRRLARQLLRRHAGAGRAAGRGAEPARQRRAGHRGRHGDLRAAAQCRRIARRGALSDRTPRGDRRRAHEFRARARFPDRRRGGRRSRGHRRGLSNRARRISPARALVEGGHRSRRLVGDRHRNPLRCAEVAAHRGAGRTRQPEEGAAARRRARRKHGGRPHRAGAANARGRARGDDGAAVQAQRAGNRASPSI